jgi:Uma2 family endonuclease
MGLAEEKRYTVEYIAALPEGEHAELIDGIVFNMASPSTAHQRLLGNLYFRIRTYINEKGGSCEAFLAPFAVFIRNDDMNYVEPDISVVCDPDKINDKGCHGAPDWIIEIVSPGNPIHDYVRKLHLYESAGVREYWIVNPSDSNDPHDPHDPHGSITVYFFENNVLARRYSFSDTIKVGIYEDFFIDFSQI